MKISDPILQIKIGANLTPENPNLSGPTHVGIERLSKVDGATSVLVARLIFSASAQTVNFSGTAGTLTPSAAGTRQVERATVVAAGGATSSGSLPLTLTGANVSGSPLAITVPLVTGTHTTQDLIAAAIRAKLATLPAVTNFYTVGGSGANVDLTSIFGLANDATLNLAIAAGLGVSAAASSANTTAGVAGVIIERAGGDGKDIYGMPWVSGLLQTLTMVGVSPGIGSVFSTRLGAVYAGQISAFSTVGFAEEITSETYTCVNSRAIVDVVTICKL